MTTTDNSIIAGSAGISQRAWWLCRKKGNIHLQRHSGSNKVFMDAVHHLWLLSDTLAADAAAIDEYILAVVQKASSADALQTLVLQLNSRLADEAIAANHQKWQFCTMWSH